MDWRGVLLWTIGGAALFHAFSWLRHRPWRNNRPGWPDIALGVVTDFFDTLGIGSYAPTTAVLTWRDKANTPLMPGTLNVGHTLPVCLQALIFVGTVSVSPLTLWSMVLASMLGAYCGAAVVTQLPKRPIIMGMGCALVIAATIQLLSLLGFLPAGGNALALTGGRLLVGILGSFVIGATNSIGVGPYAPTMIMVSLLGMDPLAAFPVMMGSSACMMPLCSTRFIATGNYNVRAALGLTLGGIPGVLLAAYVVKSLPLLALRWGVVSVVAYAAISVFRNASAAKQPKAVQMVQDAGEVYRPHAFQVDVYARVTQKISHR